MIVAVPLLWLPIHQGADTPDFRQSDPVANTRPSPLPELRLAAQFLYPLYRLTCLFSPTRLHPISAIRAYHAELSLRHHARRLLQYARIPPTRDPCSTALPDNRD